ncbi:MAG TPA: carboxypeptidase regulatory-like domain-containing protein [Archangium sp.]|uniref:carboxypeptidase regulatory-like domain-containing protein n=1 Tax=Archangium sp. TaxID=1872627 RepID=UPI002E2EB8C8|nr:carboxypeptidase regulatory-like domain-containing protein [Archangium sp.]HEX5750545.1 carboxypeptidase regulatory-like domain-containing protein [Archangium sp.]
MKRHGWMWGAVLGVLALVLWLASRGAPGVSSSGGPGDSRAARTGAGPMLQALFPSEPPTTGDPSSRIRGTVRNARGPVAGARVLASGVVAGESLSALPCRRAGEEDPEQSLLDCASSFRLSGLVNERTGDAPVLARATTGDDGSFSLEGLKAGRYALWVESPEGVGLRQDVPAGAEGVELLLGEGVRVSGLVSDEERVPVAGVLVTAIFTAHSRFFEAVTDATGHYRLGPLPRGEYVLLVSREGFLPMHTTFTAYGPELERKFILYRPRRISGQVRAAGAPAAGASVITWVYGEDAEREVLTDAAGRFTLEGLLPSSFELTAIRDGLWASARVDFHTEDGPSQFLAERTDILLELEPVVEVTGVVRDEAGRPLEGVSVELSEQDEEEEDPLAIPVASGMTDAEGCYRVGPARPGRLRLEVTSTSHVSEEDGHTAVFKAGTSTVDFVLQRLEGEEVEEAAPEAPGEPRPRLVGEVVDELGAPVSQAEVSVWPEAGKGPGHQLDHTRTDAKGHFSFSAPPEGRYRLAAEFAQDDVTHTTERVVEVGQGETRVRLRFEPGQVLSGVVVDTRGQPVEGARVELRSALRPQVFYHGRPIRMSRGSQQTGPDGRFSFQSVSGEQLELVVTKEDSVLACAEQEDGRIALPVKPGERERRVLLLRQATASGRFVQKDGSPVPSFVVSHQGWRDEDGHFSVPIRCTGTLQLEFTVGDDVDVPGFRRMRHSVSVREEVDTDLGTIVLDGT